MWPCPTPTSIALGRDWEAPLGGVLIFHCGLCALSGFPLDDVWHRIFGQDVTLWGPTHILMVGGASLATLGAWVLLVEGQRIKRETAPSIRHADLWFRLRTVSVAGALLIGMSTLQAEFDFYGGLSLVIGAIFGMSTLHFPLYIVDALVVEAAALALTKAPRATMRRSGSTATV